MNEALLHQPLRLKIMATLYAERDREPLDFPRLKRIVEATDGNLGSHLTTLETAGYVAVEKDFAGKKPRTRLALTPEGRRAFRAHVDYLREIIEAADAPDAKRA